MRSAFPAAVLIFILPPTVGELNRRLSGRGSEDGLNGNPDGTALRELGAAPDFDYVVVNDDFEAALRALQDILGGTTTSSSGCRLRAKDARE